MPRDRDADRTPCPDDVLKLIERFDRHKDAYKDGHYNEAQVRREFIDPFFVSLGWDVHNTKGYAEAYKDVIHEDSIKVGGATKAADYCFRIGRTRKFFVEARNRRWTCGKTWRPPTSFAAMRGRTSCRCRW